MAIQFARPGKIAVEGKAGKAFFFYRSDGTSTWTRDDRATSWHKPESDDMVFAEMGTEVLALLLHWKFDVFQGKTTAFKEKVVVEKIGGQPAYRVETLGGHNRSVYWIDPKSFLLRKVYSHTPFKTADFTDGGEVDTDVTFVGTKVNPPLAVRLFAKPPGVP